MVDNDAKVDAFVSNWKFATIFPIHPFQSESELVEAIRVIDLLLRRTKPLD